MCKANLPIFPYVPDEACEDGYSRTYGGTGCAGPKKWQCDCGDFGPDGFRQCTKCCKEIVNEKRTKWRSRLKVAPWQRPSSAPTPPQGTPGGSGWRGTPRREADPHCAVSYRLGCSSEPPPTPPPTPPMSPPLGPYLTVQVELRLGVSQVALTAAAAAAATAAASPFRRRDVHRDGRHLLPRLLRVERPACVLRPLRLIGGGAGFGRGGGGLGCSGRAAARLVRGGLGGGGRRS